MKILKKDIYIFLFFTLSSFILSIYFANRDIQAVEDSLNYKIHFEQLIGFNLFKYEYMFDFITYFIRLFTNNYIFYFFILNFILNFLIFLFCIKISRFIGLNYFYYIILVFSSLILSSWYVSFSVNILRHGLAILILYLSISNIFFEDKKYKGLLLSIISIFTHYSIILVLPFLLLVRIKMGYLLSITLFFIILYITEYNEFVLKYISDIFHLGIYEKVNNYSDIEVAFSYGFSWSFLLYTLSLSIFYLICYRHLFYKDKNYEKLLKIFLSLTCFFYMMGFAGYPNRYGVVSWGLTIFINSIILLKVVQKNEILYSIAVIILIALSLLNIFIGDYI